MNGVPCPRVTAVLAAAGLGPDLSMVPPAALERARARGTAVHRAVYEHVTWGVDEPAEDGIAPYFDAYLKFRAESGFEPLRAEFELIHPTWQYVGHPDLVGWLHGQRTLIDFKTGDSLDLVPATWQTVGAYAPAWNAVYPREPIAQVKIVQLRSNGTYRVHDPAPTPDQPPQVFLAALVLYRARLALGRVHSPEVTPC